MIPIWSSKILHPIVIVARHLLGRENIRTDVEILNSGSASGSSSSCTCRAISSCAWIRFFSTTCSCSLHLFDDDRDLRGQQLQDREIVLGISVELSLSRSKTPMTRSFEMIGATISDRVRFAGGKISRSLLTSGEIIGLPVWATVPRNPSPIFSRGSISSKLI